MKTVLAVMAVSVFATQANASLISIGVIPSSGNGIGAVNILHPLLDKPDWPDLRARAATLMKSMVGRAVRQGSLRDDLSERDIVFGLTRFARPLAVGLPPDEERSLAHRHLDFYLDGLCAENPGAPEPAIPGIRQDVAGERA